MKIRGILFDLDGTLIDTIDLIIQAFEHSFAVCLNKKMPRAELVKYFGLPLRSAMENYVICLHVHFLSEFFYSGTRWCPQCIAFGFARKCNFLMK